MSTSWGLAQASLQNTDWTAFYYERFQDVHNAIEREKQIKGWLRIKKISLIVSVNPAWRDLSLEWYERHQFQPDAAAVLKTVKKSELSS